MDQTDADWEQRVAALWASFDGLEEAAFVSAIEAIAAERASGDATALFERACAQDSTGHPDRAVSLYRAALDHGLEGLRRRRAVIQMASSLRNLGDPAQAAALLTAELEAPSDALDGAVRAFLALALVDLNREREAVAVSLGALAKLLPRYNRSLAGYAEALVTPPGD